MNTSRFELHLYTNNTCNLYCRHCYNSSGIPARKHIPPVSQILETLTFFCKEYNAKVHLEGGEVFLRQNLLREMDSLPDEILGVITITTNGLIYTHDERILHMLRRLDALRVSVEGHTDEQQMKLRGISLQTPLENAQFYQSQGIPIALRITLNRYNYDGFVSETIPALTGRGFQRVQVYEFQQVGRGIAQRGEFSIEHNLDSLLEEWARHGTFAPASVKLMLSSARREDVVRHKSALKRAGFQVTAVPQGEGVSVHADGAVYLCPWENRKDRELFNLYQTNFQTASEILQHTPLTHVCGHCSAYCVFG